MTENPALRIRQLRTYLGVSQRKMAKKIGVSQQTLSDWEHGRSDPTIKAIARLVVEVQRLEKEIKIVAPRGVRRAARNGVHLFLFFLAAASAALSGDYTAPWADCDDDDDSAHRLLCPPCDEVHELT